MYVVNKRTKMIKELEQRKADYDKRIEEYQQWLLANTGSPNFNDVLRNKRFYEAQRSGVHQQIINLKNGRPSHGDAITEQKYNKP